MEQPMAIDLRFILSVIKINADLERVGDSAKAISDRVRNMDRWPPPTCRRHSAHGHAGAAKWCARACSPSSRGMPDMARAVLAMDDAVDAMNKAAYKALTKVMEAKAILPRRP